MLKFLKKIEDLGKNVENLNTKLAILQQKFTEQEELLKAVKEVAGVKRQNDDIKKKQKWLNGYPDESEE